jgi:hypothetical protein
MYKSVNVFDVGKDCPSTLYFFGISFPYIPASKNPSISSDAPPPVAVELILPFAAIVMLSPAVSVALCGKDVNAMFAVDPVSI